MKNTKELLHLCQNIAGMTIKELANIIGSPCPKSLTNHKGWIGQCLEKYLGANASNLPIPDFPELGIELKTIPINPKNLTPLESTYICRANMHFNDNITWERSTVYKKLSKVLWIPIEATIGLDWLNRRIGKAFLWQPDPQQTSILKNDWEELTEILTLGNIKLLSAKYGKYLQLRPKAANCKNDLINYKTLEDENIITVARGFYLRATFTKQILRSNFK